MTDACCILLRGSIRYKGISVRGSIMTKQEAIAYITKELAKCAAELAPAEYQGNVTAKYDSSGSSSVSMKFETENLVFKSAAAVFKVTNTVWVTAAVYLINDGEKGETIAEKSDTVYYFKSDNTRTDIKRWCVDRFEKIASSMLTVFRAEIAKQ